MATKNASAPKAKKTAKATTAPKAKASKKAAKPADHKPWSVNGLTAKRFELEGFKRGDKIKFTLDDRTVTGEYLYGKTSIRHPEGRVYINYKGDIYKRVLEHIVTPSTKGTQKGA